eukprot:747314-Hanusia_phi.AAC.6
MDPPPLSRPVGRYSPPQAQDSINSTFQPLRRLPVADSDLACLYPDLRLLLCQLLILFLLVRLLKFLSSSLLPVFTDVSP